VVGVLALLVGVFGGLNDVLVLQPGCQRLAVLL